MSKLVKTRFAKRLEQGNPVILDGGLATQLEAQGCNLDNNLWSAALLRDNARQIIAAHAAYLEAGAEVIATASYQASIEGFAQQGLDVNKASALMELSVSLVSMAHAFCESVGTGPLIAASLGPYGAMLHDGSEYRGDYGVSTATLREFHASRIELFDATTADVLALETIPSIDEAKVLAELLKDTRTPAWVSFSCRDEQHLCDGTPLVNAARLFADHPTVLAVGINCTPPQFAPRLVEIVREAAPDKHAMAYPNSGEKYIAEENVWSGTVTPLDCAAAAREWIARGASIVGGCCRMGPEHIRAMRDAIT